MGLGPKQSSYTRDREARRARLKARGVNLDERVGAPRVASVNCARCADRREVVVQGKGMVPCPDCSGDAAA